MTEQTILKIRDRGEGRIKPLINQPPKKGDRNYYKVSRLRGQCAKCGSVATVQEVERHQDYSLLIHRCKECGRVLRMQRYPKILNYGRKR